MGFVVRPLQRLSPGSNLRTPRMQPRVLKTFLAVARHGNVTRAAEDVHLAQSSVSDQLQALEAELDAQLFTRTRQGLRLTAAGEALAAHAREILARIDEAKSAVAVAAGRATGAVTLGALETIAATRLASWMAAFRQAYPSIGLKLEVMGSGELLRAVGDGAIDAAFCFERGALDPRLASRQLLREPLALIAAPGSLHAQGDFAATTTAAPFIATGKGCVYRHLFDAAFARAGVAAPTPAVEVDSIRTIVRLVAAGTGMGLVPRMAAAAELARGELQEMAWLDHDAAACLLMLWRRQHPLRPALGHVIEHASARLGLTPADGLPPHAAPCRS
jgi:DNA-binding transcriptional LysR family regulator